MRVIADVSVANVTESVRTNADSESNIKELRAALLEVRAPSFKLRGKGAEQLSSACCARLLSCTSVHFAHVTPAPPSSASRAWFAGTTGSLRLMPRADHSPCGSCTSGSPSCASPTRDTALSTSSLVAARRLAAQRPCARKVACTRGLPRSPHALSGQQDSMYACVSLCLCARRLRPYVRASVTASPFAARNSIKDNPCDRSLTAAHARV